MVLSGNHGPYKGAVLARVKLRIEQTTVATIEWGFTDNSFRGALRQALKTFLFLIWYQPLIPCKQGRGQLAAKCLLDLSISDSIGVRSRPGATTN